MGAVAGPFLTEVSTTTSVASVGPDLSVGPDHAPGPTPAPSSPSPPELIETSVSVVGWLSSKPGSTSGVPTSSPMPDPTELSTTASPPVGKSRSTSVIVSSDESSSSGSGTLGESTGLPMPPGVSSSVICPGSVLSTVVDIVTDGTSTSPSILVGSPTCISEVPGANSPMESSATSGSLTSISFTVCSPASTSETSWFGWPTSSSDPALATAAPAAPTSIAAPAVVVEGSGASTPRPATTRAPSSRSTLVAWSTALSAASPGSIGSMSIPRRSRRAEMIASDTSRWFVGTSVLMSSAPSPVSRSAPTLTASPRLVGQSPPASTMVKSPPCFAVSGGDALTASCVCAYDANDTSTSSPSSKSNARSLSSKRLSGPT